MAKKTADIQPLYPLHHAHTDSLQRALSEAGQLVNVLETLLDVPGAFSDKAAPLIRERVSKLNQALYGDEAKRG